MNVEKGTETRPRYSFSGNICFEISVFCLCSVTVVINIRVCLSVIEGDEVMNGEGEMRWEKEL
jgi:hypothetical protein